MKKLGVIVNPIAGMGGSVGLKGTDGDDVYRQALRLGAMPKAQSRAEEALSAVVRKMPTLTVLTCPGAMGEDVVRRCGMSPMLIDCPSEVHDMTSAKDTRHATREMQRSGVDLLLFAGGDGTARDICDALNSPPDRSAPMTVLGIPAGVKMHSAVFALTPRRAGEIAAGFLRGDSAEVTQAEVMDIDEGAFRNGRVTAALHGYLRTPLDSGGVQSTKSGAAAWDAALPVDIARQVIADMTNDTLYIIGAGTTTAAIMEELSLPNTLLGVDVVWNGKLLASDATESDLLRLTGGKPAKIVVSVIGGQGYIFGRGNQQISPHVIRRAGRDNIIVVATREKLLRLHGRPLLVDTGDPALDDELSGYFRVITGFGESHICKVSC